MNPSENDGGRKRSIKGYLATSIVLIVLGLVPQPVFLTASAAQRDSNPTRNQGKSDARSGIITGIVVNERQEPVPRARVQAFAVRTTVPQAQQGAAVPFSMRADGSAPTDAAGRFQISGLEMGTYLVAAEGVPSVTSGAAIRTPVYATTFYPSAIDYQAAEHVPTLASASAPIQITLVQVQGARVAGTVLSRSGRSASGMDVRLFHRFGGFGSESRVAVVKDDGTFEVSGVPPGWYRLSIVPRQVTPNAGGGEFATTLLHVQEEDIGNLVMTLGTGASVSGRVVPKPDAGIQSTVGMRASASPAGDQYSLSGAIMDTVASDWSFRLTGLSGSYRFAAGVDRPPFLRATRIIVDGAEKPPDAPVELTDGDHQLVIFVAPREASAPAADPALPTATLQQFRNETVFWRQFTIGKQIADRHDTSVLPSLLPFLDHEDRHLRGNAAFIVAALGDPRGFQTIVNMLRDRSDRREAQGMPTAPGAGRYAVERQIRNDRYYAAHLLGDLRDPRAVLILAPLLRDEEINSIVPWALGQIGDKAAVAPLLDALDDDSPSMRVYIIYTLEELNAREAIPRLIPLLDDHRKSNFGAQVSVAEAARAAIAKLQ